MIINNNKKIDNGGKSRENNICKVQMYGNYTKRGLRTITKIIMAKEI